MLALLRAELEHYEPAHTGIDVAIVLLGQLPSADARDLLLKRLERVEAARALLASQLGKGAHIPGSAGEHMVMLADTERRWLRRALQRRASTTR
jgi:hypothetical protein